MHISTYCRGFRSLAPAGVAYEELPHLLAELSDAQRMRFGVIQLPIDAGRRGSAAAFWMAVNAVLRSAKSGSFVPAKRLGRQRDGCLKIGLLPPFQISLMVATVRISCSAAIEVTHACSRLIVPRWPVWNSAFPRRRRLISRVQEKMSGVIDKREWPEVKQIGVHELNLSFAVNRIEKFSQCRIPWPRAAHGSHDHGRVSGEHPAIGILLRECRGHRRPEQRDVSRHPCFHFPRRGIERMHDLVKIQIAECEQYLAAVGAAVESISTPDFDRPAGHMNVAWIDRTVFKNDAPSTFLNLGVRAKIGDDAQILDCNRAPCAAVESRREDKRRFAAGMRRGRLLKPQAAVERSADFLQLRNDQRDLFNFEFLPVEFTG